MDNPYQPPNPAVAAGPPARDPALVQPARTEAPRWLAVLVTLLGGLPLLGVGHVVIGRGRRAIGWVAAGVALYVTLIVAVGPPAPKLFLIAFVAALTAWVAALIATGRAAAGSRMTTGQAWKLLVAVLVLALGIAQVQKRWFTEAFQMPAGSMQPALLVGDHFLTVKGRSAERGDVVVFQYPPDPEVDYCKRVLAIGGDVVEFRNSVPHINGQPLDRTETKGHCPSDPDGERPCLLFEERNGAHRYAIVHDPAAGPTSFGPFTVPPGHVFVVGDNRDNSNDSRVWGTVPLEMVKARARFVYWSRLGGTVRWDRIGTVID